MKKKVLLSSVMTIVLCLCLIAGSTFALFTSQEQFDVEVTSGTVSIDASIDDLLLWSVEGNPAGDVQDENGNLYQYEDQTSNGAFLNAGTAGLVDNVLTLDRVTPGDKVSFNLNGTNNSNVTIMIRYTIKYVGANATATSTTPLVQGMLLNVDGSEYAGVTSYTSTWTTLTAGTDMATVAIELGLPVTAGNEYQNGSANYAILVEAVQGNAVVDSYTAPIVECVSALANDADSFNAALNNDSLDRVDVVGDLGTIDLTGDNDKVVNVAGGASAELNLGGNALTNNVFNSGDIVINGGDINVDNSANTENPNSCGFRNNGGNAVLNDIVMNAGDANDYSNISVGGTVEYNNVTLTANGGAIGADAGAQVTFNSGSVNLTATTTNPRYVVFAVGDGTCVTINGGTFDFTAKTLKRAHVYVGAGATVIINDGTFGTPSNRSGYSEGVIVEGTLIINGGTFGFDPTNWLGEGHTAVKTGDVWVVN